MVTFINNNINRDDVVNIKSTHISTYLQQNNTSELKKIYDFYTSSQSILLITGFGGTGKRLVVEHSTGFLAPNIIKLEYDCKAATVCDDILLNFIEIMQKSPDIKKIFAPKIENFSKTLSRYISVSSSPVLMFINSFDNVPEKNRKLILDFLFSIAEQDKIKIIITAKNFNAVEIPTGIEYSKIIAKPLSKEIFTEYIQAKNIEFNESEIDELYKLTRGYYFYTKLLSSVIINSKLSVKEFLSKCSHSGKVFDKFLCDIAISALPIHIRNFFWFLLLLRHGISYDALSVLDLYDEASVKYLLASGYIYETAGTIYVSDYFHSEVEILIPIKIKQKLHKYLIDIYKGQLQEKPEKRVLKLSRLTLNGEIGYHLRKSTEQDEYVNEISIPVVKIKKEETPRIVAPTPTVVQKTEEDFIKDAVQFSAAFKYTEATEAYGNALELINDPRKKVEIYTNLAKIYAKISEWSKSIHYYSLVEDFFVKNNEPINVNYTRYELADVYYNTFNVEEARKILKEVIFSQDTTTGLMIDACLRLGNIEDYSANYEEAFRYYKQGIESIDETTNPDTAEELYFRFAVALDESGEKENAVRYYNKYLETGGENFKSAVLCNLGTMHEEAGDLKVAESYFLKGFEFDINKNNYDGIYYSAMHLAGMYFDKKPEKALHYIKMAQNSAETLNDGFYIAQAHLLAGDYYYRMNDNEKALNEYLGIYTSVKNDFSKENLKKITDRIRDMELRLGSEKYSEIIKRHG